MIFRLHVKVITKSRENKIFQEPNGAWKVKVSTAPENGKANDRVIELVADQFKTAKSHVTIIKGLKGHDKIVEISM